jgi:hypothetical protein
MILSGIPHRGFGLFERKPEFRHHCLRPRQRLGKDPDFRRAFEDGEGKVRIAFDPLPARAGIAAYRIGRDQSGGMAGITEVRWVNFTISGVSAPCPVSLRNSPSRQTYWIGGSVPTTVIDQPLLDHLVGERQQLRRKLNAKPLCGLEI